MMDRRAFLTAMAGILAAPPVGEAQQTGRIYRVGYLSAGSREMFDEAFVRELHALGWVEVQNVALEYRWARAITSVCPRWRRSSCTARSM